MIKINCYRVVAILFSLLLFACYDSGIEGDDSFKEGVHYEILSDRLDRPANEVLEFFWYGCPHCFEANPHVEEWRAKNTEAALTIRHSQLNKSWMPDAMVFYGILGHENQESIHNKYFTARQNGRISSESDLNELLGEFGLTFEGLMERASSAETRDILLSMRDIETSIDSRGVPAFIVGGEYKVLLGGLGSSGGWDSLGDLLDHLLSLSLDQ